MRLPGILRKFSPRHFYSWLVRNENIDKFSFDSADLVAQTIKKELNFDQDLLNIFVNNNGPIIHKWHHYIPIYEELLKPYRDKKFNLLEIGVSRGGESQDVERIFWTESDDLGNRYR